MALNLTLSIVTKTDSYEVRVTQRLIVAVEAKFGEGFPKLLTSGKLTPIYWCAYEGTRLAGTTVPASFEKWLDELEDVTVTAGDDPKDK